MENINEVVAEEEKSNSDKNQDQEKPEIKLENISQSIKEINSLVELILTTEENSPTIQSIKEKLTKCLQDISTIQQNQPSQENINAPNPSTILQPKNSNNEEKMDLMLSKIDIIIKMMRENKNEETAVEAFYDKIYENGDKYVGSLVDGKRQGKGKMYYANKEFYEGEWVNDQRYGKGVIQYSNGDKYEGTFQKDLMDGNGIYYFKNGRQYEGEFVKGLMEGKGKYKFPTGNEYIGEFKNGLFNGRAVFLYANGDRYEGMYLNGKKSGAGVYFYKTGEKYQGEWLKDERNGKGILFHRNGELETQCYDHGKPCKNAVKNKTNDK